MKKAKDRSAHDLRPEYRKSDFPKGLVRGKYVSPDVSARVVRLDPEIAVAFPTSAAVNKALGGLLRKARGVGAKTSVDRARAKPKRARVS